MRKQALTDPVDGDRPRPDRKNHRNHTSQEKERLGRDETVAHDPNSQKSSQD